MSETQVSALERERHHRPPSTHPLTRPYASVMAPLRVSVVSSLALLAAGSVLASTRVRAATPEEAPPESREQVQVALARLTVAFDGVVRSLDAGAAGTLEEAMGRFAPKKFHPVDEGVLLPVQIGARCPAEMRLVADRVCVDRFEASLLERTAGPAHDAGTAVREHSPYHPPEPGRVYIARSRADAVPQAYVTGAQAQSACRAAGKRLCQPVEWRAACGGKQGFAFPYGKSRVATKCHDRGVAPMLVFFADTMKRGWGPLELNDPRLNQQPGTVGKTGAYPECVNDYGLYDMVGNLHEWTADPNGTFQGGYWLDTSQHGDGCAYRTIAHPFDYRDYSIGFRCCADPVSSPSRRD